MTCEATISAPAEIVEKTEFVVVDGNGSSEAPVTSVSVEVSDNGKDTSELFVQDPVTGVWYDTSIRSPKGENEGSGDNIDYAPAIRGSQRARGNLCRPRGR